jgi:acetyl-CoA carboxylase carboxyl transferase subunit beta
MAWFKKTRKPIASTAEKSSRVPEGMWIKCPGCTQIIYNKDLDKNQQVCPKCAHHFRISAADRLRSLFDDGQWTEHFPGLRSNDPLTFTDTKPYRDRLRSTIAKTGMKDALVVATGTLDGREVVVAAMNCVHRREHGRGCRREDHARDRDGARETPAAGRHLVLRRANDGRRTVAHADGEGIGCARQTRSGATPFISVLTDRRPASHASFAMLGDLNIAEPKALIGFAGPRVIEQTIRQKLPEGFQRSEFLLEHGMLDLIVDRRDLKPTLARALSFMDTHTAPAVPVTVPSIATSESLR